MKEMSQDSEGLPLAVQVVGKPNMDEQVLRVMHQLQTCTQITQQTTQGPINENENLSEVERLLV